MEGYGYVMRKIHLVIVDDDTYYIESFMNYIRNTDYSNRLNVKVFSKKETLHEYLSKEENIDILLINSELAEGISESPHISSIFLLSEKKLDHRSDYPLHIFKFQPLNDLLSQIITLHYDQNPNSQVPQREKNGAKVFSVYSATGGAGKTTFAYNLSKVISAQNDQVLYLNLETINSTPLLFNVDHLESASPLLYYVKTMDDHLVEKISEFISNDHRSSVSFFNFVPSAEEIYELTDDELNYFIDCLIDTEIFQYIILDLDTAVNDKTLRALRKSDHVFWMLNNDIQSFHKTGYLLEDLHSFLKDGLFRERVKIILNRFTGKLNQNFKDFSFTVHYYLPYISEWKEIGSGIELSMNRMFNRSVLSIFNELKKEGLDV